MLHAMTSICACPAWHPDIHWPIPTTPQTILTDSSSHFSFPSMSRVGERTRRHNCWRPSRAVGWTTGAMWGVDGRGEDGTRMQGSLLQILCQSSKCATSKSRNDRALHPEMSPPPLIGPRRRGLSPPVVSGYQSFPASHEITGYMPFREEFEVCFDNEAEASIKDLIFVEGDTTI